MSVERDATNYLHISRGYDGHQLVSTPRQTMQTGCNSDADKYCLF